MFCERGVKELANELLMRAIEDLWDKKTEVRNSAKAFLTEGNPYLEYWAGLAGLEPEAIINSPLVREYLLEK